MENITLNSDDQTFFKDWIKLNLMGISWEGRYLDDFNRFWEQLFKIDISLKDQFSAILFLRSSLTEGPLISWVNWIFEKFVCYSFVYKGLSIKEIALLTDKEPTDISTSLRDFFVERYPHLEDLLNEKFQIGNLLSPHLHLTFKGLQDSFDVIDDSLAGALDSEVLGSLEITLYAEWPKMNQLFTETESVVLDTKLTTKRVIGKQLRFLSELLLLFLIGGAMIFFVKFGYSIYEDYLEKEISLFEPNFFWLDKSLSFESEKKIDPSNISISLDELEELERIESKAVFKDEVTDTRFEVESDVVLTSVDSLPKDFDVADLEQSTYEEVKKGGYRNNRFGRRKAYRVMLTSVDPRQTKLQLVRLLKRYDVKQVDNVKPGTEIPGGIYFNLNVPRNLLKEFLSKVSSVEEESTILESKTVSRGPAGTNRVFIWIKSI